MWPYLQNIGKAEAKHAWCSIIIHQRLRCLQSSPSINYMGLEHMRNKLVPNESIVQKNIPCEFVGEAGVVESLGVTYMTTGIYNTVV